MAILLAALSPACHTPDHIRARALLRRASPIPTQLPTATGPQILLPLLPPDPLLQQLRDEELALLLLRGLIPPPTP